MPLPQFKLWCKQGPVLSLGHLRSRKLGARALPGSGIPALDRGYAGFRESALSEARRQREVRLLRLRAGSADALGIVLGLGALL